MLTLSFGRSLLAEHGAATAMGSRNFAVELEVMEKVVAEMHFFNIHYFLERYKQLSRFKYIHSHLVLYCTNKKQYQSEDVS